MDKKKVKKLLEDADICLLGYERNGCRDLVQMGLEKLHEAQEELSKSDWVSVEDRLPEYFEKVLVCNEKAPNYVYQTNRTDKSKIFEGIDKNGFNQGHNLEPITHWKPIEKLEE